MSRYPPPPPSLFAKKMLSFRPTLTEVSTGVIHCSKFNIKTYIRDVAIPAVITNYLLVGKYPIVTCTFSGCRLMAVFKAVGSTKSAASESANAILLPGF